MQATSISTATTALSYGPEVAELRALGHAQGRVLAVLSNALYLQSDMGHVVCVAGPEAEDGPLTLRVSRLPMNLHAGERFALSRLDIEWGQARVWRPELPDRLASAADGPANKFAGNDFEVPIRGLLRNASTQNEPVRAGGLRLGSLRIHSPGIVDRGLESRSANLARAIKQHQTENIRDAVLNLLGLGHGLTPSGDDVVMGAVAMLVWRSRLGDFPGEAAQSVAQAIRAHAPKRTNLISARLLDYACEGVLYEPAIELGAALLAGNTNGISALTRRLLVIGSSTGADIAAGLLAALRGYL